MDRNNLKYYKNLLCWFVIHLTHWILYFGNTIAVVMCILYEPWYIALPILTMVSNPLIFGVHCVYNNLENRYRGALGWPLIQNNFIEEATNALRRKFKK